VHSKYPAYFGPIGPYSSYFRLHEAHIEFSKFYKHTLKFVKIVHDRNICLTHISLTFEAFIRNIYPYLTNNLRTVLNFFAYSIKDSKVKQSRYTPWRRRRDV
jgi:hypothetical protein